MTTPVTVRDFTDNDSSSVIAIARMLQAHERRYFDCLKPPGNFGTDYLVSLQTDVAAHQGRILVACQGGSVVGYASLLIRYDNRDDAEEAFYEYSYVGDLAVHEDHRRSGVGRALIAACEQTARASGMKWLRLAVLAENAMARDFYRNNGFRDHLIQLEKPL